MTSDSLPGATTTQTISPNRERLLKVWTGNPNTTPLHFLKNHVNRKLNATKYEGLSWVGTKMLAAADYVGEGVANILGLNESKFQYVIDGMSAEDWKIARQIHENRKEADAVAELTLAASALELGDCNRSIEGGESVHDYTQISVEVCEPNEICTSKSSDGDIKSVSSIEENSALQNIESGHTYYIPQLNV